MNYDNPELIERLAAEYVLGTLKGRARRRFESLMSNHQWIRATVWEWEARLSPIAGAVDEVAPPERVQKNIEDHLDNLGATKPGILGNINFWRGWSFVATAAAIALIAILPLPTDEVPREDHVAVFNDQDSKPLWLISADLDTGKVTFRSVNEAAIAVDKVFELWMLPAGDQPRSLGLLPVTGGEVHTQIPPGLLAVLRNTEGLAVSIEPIGGSPTGLPTGPVVYQASLLEL